MPILMAIGGSMIAKWVYSVLASLGIAFISVRVLQTVMESLYTRFQGYIGELPQLTVELLGLCNVDLALNVVFTAYVWRMAVSVFLAKRVG